MRIVLSNPDSIGDVVLRQPMFAALRAAGHEVIVIVRAPWLPMMANIAPGCQIILLEGNPYGDEKEWQTFHPAIEKCRLSKPDALVVASYQWTAFEEKLAAELKVPVYAMSGRLFSGDPRDGTTYTSSMKIDYVAKVSEDLLELKKNERLTSCVLGTDIPLAQPKIVASERQIELARQKLSLKEKFWVACVGNNDYTAVRNWRIENWIESLKFAIDQSGRKIVLLGDESERAVNQQIAAAVTGVLLPDSLSLDELIGAIALSEGYIGKDTGPMHLSAALGKPVVAVFGGGTWPRFIPTAQRGRVLTVKVPCRGCDWICHLKESHCVKDVSVEAVKKAIDDLHAGKISSLEVVEFGTSPQQHDAMLCEANQQMRETLLCLGKAERLAVEAHEQHQKQLYKLQQEHATALEQLRSQLAAQQFKTTQLTSEVEYWRGENSHLQAYVREQQARIDEHYQRALRMTNARWHKLGRALGLKLEGVTPPTNGTSDNREDVNLTLTDRPKPPELPVVPRQDLLPDSLPDGKPWPKISIVTPTFNQGRYIEGTILSILNQDYPNLEHIVMDGGSTDQTLEVLAKYKDKIAIIVSEKDRGQSDAINKGMAQATGEIVTWLNSDDMLAPGALRAMALAFHTSGADMVAGVCQLSKDEVMVGQHITSCADGTELPLNDLLDLDNCWNAGQFFYQPEVMFKRSLWNRAGGHVVEKLYYSMDYEMWLRFALAKAKLHVIGKPIAHFRMHPEQKTHDPAKFQAELVKVREEFCLKNNIRYTQPPKRASLKQSIRVAMLNDHGFKHGAGIAHERMAGAVALGGHEVIPFALSDGTSFGAEHAAPAEDVVEGITEAHPDLVIMGNMHSMSAGGEVTEAIAKNFPSAVVLHDTWMFTGRCAYTGTCDRYLSHPGCNHECPTADQYPVLPPGDIAAALNRKRELLRGRNAPLLLANSQWMLKFAEHAIAKIDSLPSLLRKRIAMMRLAVPTDLFFPRDKKACREALDLPTDRFLLLFSASSIHDPRKGVSHLIKAVAKLGYSDITCVCVGWYDGKDRPDLPDLRVMGHIEDPQKLALIYGACDVFVGPSLEEAFGQVYIEAAACGAPAIGYPIGGVPEAICDGVTGLVAKAVHPDALAEAIAELHNDVAKRQLLSRLAPIYIENEFNLAVAMHRLHVALQDSGLAERIGMSTKINLRPDQPRVPSVRVISAPTVAT